MSVCTIEGCGRLVEGHGFCSMHYQRWKRTGSPHRPEKSPICSVEGCEKPRRTRGWCSTHYDRWLHNGDPLELQRIRGDHEARFWSKVSKQPAGCWDWVGVISKAGYASFSVMNKTIPGHRYAYELLVGPIPDGLTIDHLCRNTRCVNPEHLEPVTIQENIRRSNNISVQNARKTHCKSGHPFDEQNTYITSKGHRLCRICHRAWKQAWAQRKAAS